VTRCAKRRWQDNFSHRTERRDVSVRERRRLREQIQGQSGQRGDKAAMDWAAFGVSR
jgi:hypothetical protein